ncbi:GH92 family glycosyl hydrolase [Actinoallomurus bryophytorum]|uniref:Putative alpha-1,2-mannosidase n=1 Tax=Actinoallomurus bryophytorum TaxID=1490222 RepID=A0A543C0R7_9ACTN|nr:GH92 family glycosyl hydrolase [Actinoallomurus bryophytorum]TQL90670.1 putative alpha-1,2-mannosidase [Actinoallomurus bryophytorum]
MRRSAARLAAAVALATATVLGSGLPALAQGPSPVPSPGTQLKNAHANTATCVKGPDGRLTDCPKPLAAKALPKAAKETATLSNVSDPASLVDTRTWTTGGGNTFPGADVPYGMVQWSPDTMPHRNAGGGYNYGDEELTGYSLTHVSGPGCGAAGDIPILPITGDLPSGDPNEATTAFTNAGEVAQAGYYSAQSNLPDTITTQLTETPHSAMGRFTFPSTTQAGFLIKLMDSQNGDSASSAQIVGNNEIKGSDTSGGFCGDSAKYTVYYDITFDRPFTASKVITGSGSSPQAASVTFDTTKGATVQAKVGISYVSADNAALNWRTENPGWNFDSVKKAAQKSWNTLLGRMNVSGSSAATTQLFYSALYHNFIQPNITSDVNGQFMGSDVKVHSVSGKQKQQYGMYSGWDTYHSVAQLQAMLTPKEASDQAQSQVNYYAENGIIQQWGYLHLDNWVMAGDPGSALIADYYAFGAKDFDTKTALANMVKQATTVNDVRPGTALEDQYGYLPEDGTYGCCNPHAQVSSLLEYDSADFALSRFAASLGDSANATKFQDRANNWANVFNTSTGLLTPRLKNGAFLPGITPSTSSHYIEGTAEQYLWDVPNDYAGLFSLLGGNAKVKPALRKFLSRPDGNGEYALLSNEFGHGEEYAPDYAGDPAGAQQAANTLRYGLYLPGPSGLQDNDDLGANSAAFVWSMLGMYPENPGSDTLVFGSPGFPRATISLPSGKTIKITAPDASPSEYYVKSQKINGKANSKLYVPFSTLAKGATIDWKMSTAETSWGTGASDAPPSYGPTFAATGALSPSSVNLRPGGSAKTTLTVKSVSSGDQAVQWTASAPSGVTVSPSSGTLNVPSGGSASVDLTVTAGDTDGNYPINFTLTSPSGKILPVSLGVIVAKPGDLTPFYDNAGISDDSAPSGANYDGGGWSYSEQALTAAGLAPGASVTSGGIAYTWPDVPAGQPDNISVGGQNIPVDSPAGATKLGFLGSAHNAGTDGSSGTATITYTDGSSSTATLGFSDWTLSAGSGSPLFGNVITGTTPYRNYTTGKDGVKTYVFSQTIPITAGKTVASVTLPPSLSTGAIGVFAIAAG